MSWKDEIKKDVPEFGYPNTKVMHSPMAKDADRVSDLLSEAYNRLYDNKELQEKFLLLHKSGSDGLDKEEAKKDFDEGFKALGIFLSNFR
tara:strand:- start:3799 stop:4068 length:270 start_codon:yes stop_codon:yes gene_type:complete